MLSQQTKSRLYDWGASHLPKLLPDALFWPVWYFWNKLSASKELKQARSEFYKSITKQIEIEQLVSKYSSDRILQDALFSVRKEALEAFRFLSTVH